jgi:hypothetical protein
MKQYGWVVKGPDNQLYYATFGKKMDESKQRFLTGVGSVNWKPYYKAGYRCVKAQIREGWK